MALDRHRSSQAILLLLAMLMASQAKAKLNQCLINQLNAALQSQSVKTWDERYPGNSVAQTLDRILLGKVSREDGNKEVLNEMKESFRARGIQFKSETNSEGQESLIILPIARDSDPNANSLNRLATGILKYDPNFELRYTPAMISESYTDGVYALQGVDELTSHPFIEIGHAAAIEGSAKDQVLVHEVIHAKHAGDERKGKARPFSITAHAIDPTSGFQKRTGLFPSTHGSSYNSFFKLDELITFRHNLWASARSLTEALRRGQDPSHSRIQINAAISGLVNISKKAWASADIADTALKELEKAKNLKWDRLIKFERGEIKYKGSIHFVKGTDGKPYVLVKTEELPGLFSRRKAVTSFALKIPLKAGFTPESGIPARLIHESMENLRRASKQTFQEARDALLISEKLEKPEELTALEKASLLQQLEKATKRTPLPGYSIQ